MLFTEQSRPTLMFWLLGGCSATFVTETFVALLGLPSNTSMALDNIQQVPPARFFPVHRVLSPHRVCC